MFNRWDALDERDDRAVVIFFAPPNVLSGLFILANFDETDPQVVITPFGSGCSSIVYLPYQEIDAERPRAVLGMFDRSARLRRALAQVRLDGRDDGRKLPDYRFLAQGALADSAGMR